MSIPTELVGAWRRSGLLLDGRRVVDHCDVIWLQTPGWYADIRLRIDPDVTPPAAGIPAFFFQEFSFAGPASWDPPTMTWEHLLDSHLEPSMDANPLMWEDGVAAEHGTATVDGTPVTFVEEWLRMTGDDVIWSEEHRVDERGRGWARIEVGRWAVEIRDDRPGGIFVATRWDRIDGIWSAARSIVA